MVTGRGKCQKCGRPIQPGKLICECGALLQVSSGEISFGDVEFEKPAAPDLDFQIPSQDLGEIPGIDQSKTEEFGVELKGAQLDRGRAYRPVFVIGEQESGEEKLRLPFGVALLPTGDFYVIDFKEENDQARVQRFTAGGEHIKVVGEFAVGDGPEELDTPAGIAADRTENFYIADMGLHCIKKFDPDGRHLGTYGSEGTAENQLMAPQDVDLDGQGNLFIADTENSRILKWNPSGQALLALGTNLLDEDFGWLMAGEEPGEFDEPQGVTTDGAGKIYVADSNNHRVQVFSPAGEFLFAFGEEGDQAGEFDFPEDIRVTADGNIYVSDLDGQRIQKFDPEGNFNFEIMLPGDAGKIGDFAVTEMGEILVGLRKSNLVLKLEII